MNYKTFFLLISSILLAFTYPILTSSAGNHTPVVTNAHALQRLDTFLVDIVYDVEDEDGDVMTVSVQISADGGKTFDVPAETFSGDVGPGITSGKGKHIVWDAGADAPRSLL